MGSLLYLCADECMLCTLERRYEAACVDGVAECGPACVSICA